MLDGDTDEEGFKDIEENCTVMVWYVNRGKHIIKVCFCKTFLKYLKPLMICSVNINQFDFYFCHQYVLF